MDKNKQRGNIVFFIGVLIFAAAFIVGWLTEVSAVVIDLVMGVGLIIEFIGICICYKKDKDSEEVKEEHEEVKALKEEKVKIEEEKTDDVIEVEKPAKEVKTSTKKASNKATNKNTSGKKNATKNNASKKTTKKSTGKKSGSTKKNTGKKKTTKKNNTKKTSK